MNPNRQSSIENRQSNGPRKRLSKKQYAFLFNVFETGQHITDALRNLSIRHDTFERWLTSPIFVTRLRRYLNQYSLQARLELARSASQAVSGLAFLSEKSLRHGEVRGACNDILKLYAQLAKNTPVSKAVENDPKREQVDVISEQLGVTVDNVGVILDNLCDTENNKNRVLNVKNEEDAEKSQKMLTRSSDSPATHPQNSCVNN